MTSEHDRERDGSQREQRDGQGRTGSDHPAAINPQGERAQRGGMVEDAEGRKGGAGRTPGDDPDAGASGTGSGERGGGGWSEATGGADGRKTGGEVGHDEDAGGGGRHS